MKLLAPLADHPIIYWAVTHAAAICDRVIVVLGHEAQVVQGTVPDLDNVEVVINGKYREGMFSSIRRGAAEVTASWFFIAPGDMPFLKPSLYREIATAVNRGGAGTPAAAAGGCVACFPIRAGITGHPVLVSASVLPDLLAAGADYRSMRDFLRRRKTCQVEVNDEAIHLDIDTTDRYRELVARAPELL